MGKMLKKWNPGIAGHRYPEGDFLGGTSPSTRPEEGNALSERARTGHQKSPTLRERGGLESQAGRDAAKIGGWIISLLRSLHLLRKAGHRCYRCR